MQNESNDRAIENRIAEALWRWKFARIENREWMLADIGFAAMLECWFPFGEIVLTRGRGVWCDGVAFVEIQARGRLSFVIAGVGYFPIDLAPFELEFHFSKRRDPAPQAKVFRFGLKDTQGDLRLIGHCKHPANVFRMRPKQDCDWAVVTDCQFSRG